VGLTATYDKTEYIHLVASLVSPENVDGPPAFHSVGVFAVDILKLGFADSCLGGCSSGNSSDDDESVSVSVFGSVGASFGSCSQAYLLLQGIGMVDCFDKHQGVSRL
jgi:hypothetical protein